MLREKLEYFSIFYLWCCDKLRKKLEILIIVLNISALVFITFIIIHGLYSELSPKPTSKQWVVELQAMRK